MGFASASPLRRCLLCAAAVGLLRTQRQLAIMDARLGADVVVAAGVATQARQPLLIDLPQRRAIDQETLAAIQRLPGIDLAVPLYNMGKLSAEECPSCAFGYSPQFVGVDPQTAFNIRPWWNGGAALPLTEHTLIAGWGMPTYLLNADWSMFGQSFTVAGILQPTGTPLDDTMLLTTSAAQRLAKIRAAGRQAAHAHSTPQVASQPTSRFPNGVSTVLIRTRRDVEPQQVATQIALQGWNLDVAVAPAYVTALRRDLSRNRRLVGLMGKGLLTLAAAVGIAAWLPATVRRKLRFQQRAEPKMSAANLT